MENLTENELERLAIILEHEERNQIRKFLFADDENIELIRNELVLIIKACYGKEIDDAVNKVRDQYIEMITRKKLIKTISPIDPY